MQPQQLDATVAAGSAKSGSIAPPPSSSSLGRFEIYQQDIKGAVWFDDIVVFQLPRVGVKVPKTALGNIFAANQKVDLDMVVSDLGAGSNDLDVHMRITDPEGLVFAAEQWNAITSPDQAWTRRFSHAAFPAGMYTATLEVAQTGDVINGKSTDRALIARRQTQFLCFPPATLGGQDRPAPEFGLGASVSSRGGAGENRGVGGGGVHGGCGCVVAQPAAANGGGTAAVSGVAARYVGAGAGAARPAV